MYALILKYYYIGPYYLSPLRVKYQPAPSLLHSSDGLLLQVPSVNTVTK